MKRQAIRESKRAIREGACHQATPLQIERARAAALSLLERSIAMGHDRLALRRLIQAIELGATLSSSHWAYCVQVASRIDVGEVEKMLHNLRRLHQS